MLAIVGAILLIFGAINPVTTVLSVPANHPTPINYTLNYVGVAILVAAIATALASSKSKLHIATTAKTAN